MDTQERYIWPPNWDGISQNVNGSPLLPINRRWIVELYGLATASEDETDVRKIVIGDMALPDGSDASKMVIEKIGYSCSGFANVKLMWERDPDNLIARFIGNSEGDISYRKVGGLTDDASGKTGDVMLTTLGGDTNDSYLIRVEFRLK